MIMLRPIHYAAHGRRSLAFDCFVAEVVEWEKGLIDEPGPLPGWMQRKATTPYPRKTTDLSKITCPECWKEIRRMAKEQSK